MMNRFVKDLTSKDPTGQGGTYPPQHPGLKTNRSCRIFMISGDPSGDIFLGRVARHLKCLRPRWQLQGLGANYSRDAGVQLISDTSGCSSIGLASALPLIPRLLWLFFRAKRFIRANPTDYALLCDWGGFNGRFAQNA